MVANLNSVSSKANKCPKCEHYVHKKGVNAICCEICSTSLVTKNLNVGETVKNNNSNKVALNSFLQNFKLPNIKQFKQLESQKLQLGLVLSALGLGLLFSFTNNLSKNRSKIISTEQQSEIMISGLSSYGGDPIFAPLVANGLNKAIETKYPNLQLRYAKPGNGDFSSVKGIEMLLQGELSFAYNARPLTDDEYEVARRRGFELRQTPIAIDGISVFSNLWTPTARLNLQQVKKIFAGEITNWQQINPQYESMPIVPIIVNNENYGTFDFQNFPTAIKLSGYTEVIKKVINTPGAISLASASLVQNQRLIKVYSIADGNSSFINLFNNNKLDSTVIKTGAYPLTRRLFLVFREDNTNDRVTGEAVTNFLTSQPGQKIIEKSNYVPLN